MGRRRRSGGRGTGRTRSGGRRNGKQRKQETRLSQTTLDDLPNDLLETVFSNVDFRCVCISKTLSKRFLSILEGDPFKFFYTNHNASIVIPIYWQYSGDNELYYLPLTNENRMVLPSIPICTPDDLFVVTSCNGVILLANDNATYIVLWNPLTREVRILPPLVEEEDLKTGELGLEFDGDAYVIVRIDLDGERIARKDEALYYHSGTDSPVWNKVPFPKGLKFKSYLNGSYCSVNNHPYWLCDRDERSDTQVQNTFVLLSFVNSIFNTYQTPPYLREIWERNDESEEKPEKRNKLVGIWYSESTLVVKEFRDEGWANLQILEGLGEYGIERWFLTTGDWLIHQQSRTSDEPYAPYLIVDKNWRVNLVDQLPGDLDIFHVVPFQPNIRRGLLAAKNTSGCAGEGTNNEGFGNNGGGGSGGAGMGGGAGFREDRSAGDGDNESRSKTKK